MNGNRISRSGSPLANPCFAIRNWGHKGAARVKTEGAGAKDVRQGVINDNDGTRTMVIWLEVTSTSDVTLNISDSKPSADYATGSP
jgi:hypothetical protein